MKNIKKLLVSALVVIPLFSIGQVTVEDYQRAEMFLQQNLGKSIYRSWVSPVWQSDNSTFVYNVTTRKGKEFYRVNPDTKHKSVAFNHDALASMLSDSLGEKVEPYDLPISRIKQIGWDELTFWAKERQWAYNSSQNLLRAMVSNQPSRKESQSPNGKWIAFISDGNIYLREKNPGQEHQLTTNGTPENGYGHTLSWYFTRNDSKGEKNDYNIEVYWSQNSQKLIVPKFDRRNTRWLQLFKVDVEGYQSEIVSYERSLAGDTAVTMVDYYLFDVDDRKPIKVDLPANPAFLGTNFYNFKDNPKAYHVRYYRGYKTRELFEVDLETGNTRSILTESYPKTFVDIYTETLEVDYKNDEFIWRSEQDGWSHLYRYSLSGGELKNQITKGNYYVYGVEHFDSKTGTIWFTAGGVDLSRDPYQKYLYSIDINGKRQKLLTPEEATHDISISPDKKYFVDNYSTHKDPNIAVVRNLKNGKVLMEVEKADIDDLLELAWKPSEPFSMLADDGKTMLYGTIIKPTNFDATKKYPVIDGTYTGPHTIRTPKTFARSVLNMDLSLGELGFVVVNIDGRGTAYRSKEFHDVSYARLGYGLTDHVYVIKQLAEIHPYIDAERVGIYGHSAGGYDATRALLLFPDFYKVGVSSAADHDHRMEKIWWPELYQGFPVDSQYHNQSNVTNASKLKGNLMIVTGDLDNNVNPSATYKLAGELVKANKDFEFIVLPNDNHDTCYWNKYFLRKRWDFFVKHLLGQDHPKEYTIK